MGFKMQLKLIFYKLFNKKLIIINEAAGLGDYLWIRNYFKLIKKSAKYKKYKIILCATARWAHFAHKLDCNYVDVILPFNDPYNPKFREIWILKIIQFDLFLNLREYDKHWATLTNIIKSKEKYDNKTSQNLNYFYHNKHNLNFGQILSIPNNFKHEIVVNSDRVINERYCILTVGGFSLGKFSETQLKVIINTVCKYDRIKILLLGLGADKKIFENLKNTSSDIKNTLLCGCGNYDTVDLCNLVLNCEYAITVNTSIWHLLIQQNKPHLCFCENQEWVLDSLTYSHIDKNFINLYLSDLELCKINEKDVESSVESFLLKLSNIKGGSLCVP